MKVRALEAGFFGRYITEGEEFEVPNDTKLGTWFVPVKEKAGQAAKKGEQAGNEDLI